MDRVTIQGVRPYDGEYDFDLEGRPLTTREWGWIKRLAGYLPVNIEEGLTDPELIVVFAVIALYRSGKIEYREVPDVFSRLSDAPFGSSVQLETETVEEEKEEDAGPPGRSSNVNETSNGHSSSRSSETSAPIRTVSGTHGSDISESVQETLPT